MVIVLEKIPTGLAAPPPSPRRRRGWRVVLLIVGVAMVVVLASTAYVTIRYETRSHPGAKAVSSAVNNYRHSDIPSGSGTTYGIPSTGVYSLHGHGSEQISFPPNSQQDGAVMPATVTHLANGCWRWHLDYNTAHAEEFVFCPTQAGLTQPTNINIQHWNYGAFSVSNTSTVTCPAGTIVLPAMPAAGQTLTWTCPETNTAIAGESQATTKATIVGIEDVRVGSSTVVTAHELQQTTLSGVQTGAVTENWWFDVATGLPVQVERQIIIHTNSPLGAITYSESGSWQMASLTPRT